MKRFRQLISEVAQPISGDERKFKEKHVVAVIDNPVALDTQYKGVGSMRSAKRPADNIEDDKTVVHSADFNLDKGRANPPENPRLKYYKAAQIKMKIIDENSSMKPVTPAGGEYDCEDTHIKYKKGNKSTKLKVEEGSNPYAIGMATAEKAKHDLPPLKKDTIIMAHKIAKKIIKTESTFILDDGSEHIIESTEFKLLEDLYNILSEENKEIMMEIASKDSDGLSEMILFARECNDI